MQPKKMTEIRYKIIRIKIKYILRSTLCYIPTYYTVNIEQLYTHENETDNFHLKHIQKRVVRACRIASCCDSTKPSTHMHFYSPTMQSIFKTPAAFNLCVKKKLLCDICVVYMYACGI